ncbi:VOC family protein [Nocardia sp. BMG111209]|uniref:VOC family protein n=1 Tax=Nocardia sp. BMG111209 TaxID=1160137 RepID=UPI00036FEC11|nr:VOC family protein [Nocardia sp. BMG111209]
MEPKDLYHTGMVVDDLEAAKKWYTDTAGYKWSKVVQAPQYIWTPEGEKIIFLKICYSGENLPHRLELIETIPGTVWTPTDSGPHHHGRWSADVDADIAVLDRKGIKVEAKALLPNGPALWAYCKGPVGPRIELVGPLMKPLVELFFATADLP